MAIIEGFSAYRGHVVGGAVMDDHLGNLYVTAVILGKTEGVSDGYLVVAQVFIENGILDKVAIHFLDVGKR